MFNSSIFIDYFYLLSLDIFVKVAWVIECACKLFIKCGVISW